MRHPQIGASPVDMESGKKSAYLVVCILSYRLLTLYKEWETSLVVQWLRLHASTAGGMGSIPSWGSQIPHATWRGKKKKKDNPPRPGGAGRAV